MAHIICFECVLSQAMAREQQDTWALWQAMASVSGSSSARATRNSNSTSQIGLSASYKRQLRRQFKCKNQNFELETSGSSFILFGCQRESASKPTDRSDGIQLRRADPL